MSWSRISLVSGAVIALAGGLVTVTAANAGTPRCTTSVLALSHTRHDIGAGNGVEDIVFTNRGSATCVLGGFPGVAYVAKSGKQLGAAADRAGSSHGAIVLPPGGRARARLGFINNVSAVPGCYHPYQQAPAVGLRVYPPGSTLAMFLRDPHPGCKSGKVHLLHIYAVRSR